MRVSGFFAVLATVTERTFDFEDGRLKQFQYWDPVKDDMPMTYKRFCEASTEDFRAKIRYAPPCERLRYLL